LTEGQLANVNETLIFKGAAMLADWIQEQRTTHRPEGCRLPRRMRKRLEPWFEIETLQIARVRVVPFIMPPAFVPTLLNGADMAFEKMKGLALIDTILVTDPRPRPDLLFHEVVHVAQYRRLGLKRFAEAYVRGLLSARLSYGANPMELRAFMLQDLFTQGSVRPFCVDAHSLPGDELDEPKPGPPTQ